MLDIENETVTENDVLVMATDGLWDVVTNERVASVVDKGLQLSPKGSAASLSDQQHDVRQKYKFISIAQELVMAARGKN